MRQRLKRSIHRNNEGYGVNTTLTAGQPGDGLERMKGMEMKTLLRDTDPLYLRRLAREINRLADAPYHHGLRVYKARVTREGFLMILVSGAKAGGEWRPSIDADFFDGNGRRLCASRENRSA